MKKFRDNLAAFLMLGAFSALVICLPVEHRQESVAQAQQPTPAPYPLPNIPVVMPKITATINGPTEWAAGRAFVVSYEVTEGKTHEGHDIQVTWENDFPKGALPPLKVKDDSGARMFLFFDSVDGDYNFRVKVQYPSVNPPLDPVVHAVHTTKVGKGKPQPGPAPQPVPTPSTPSAELQTLLNPVKAIVAAGDRAKAEQLQSIINSFLNVLKAGTVPNTTLSFEAALQAFINTASLDAGLAGAFPGYSAALDSAVDKFLGAEDTTLSPAKAIEFVSALVWAAGG